MIMSVLLRFMAFDYTFDVFTLILTIKKTLFEKTIYDFYQHTC
jgi:hypothetical protein